MNTRIAVVAVLLLLIVPSLAFPQSSEQVNLTAIQSGPIQNKTFDSTNSFANITITGTIPGGASYTSIFLPDPTLSGAISGSATWASPGSIGAGTAAPGRFSTLTATTEVVVGTAKLLFGTGTPEGAVTAVVGSQFFRTDGGTGTTLYIKESGAGNTGWVAVSAGGAVTWSTPGTIGSTTPNTGAFTTLSATGQITSTLSTGTAPLVIASTTKATNLNVDLLDGFDWTIPGTIGSTTPNSGAFTSLSASAYVAVGAPRLFSGAGTPEASVTATPGGLYLRTDGVIGFSLYTKEVGSGNTGWRVIQPPTIDWSTPGFIGETTPNTANFTTLDVGQLVQSLSFPTYGATVALNAGAANIFSIVASNGSAFTIQNPTSELTGQVIHINVKNTSGGALGTITWDTKFKLAAFTKPLNGFQRTVTFFYDGAFWVEMSCSPEVPN